MTVYDFTVEKTNGENFSLSGYKGKVLLIVNTASKCTFTPQFDDLQKIYDDYRDKGVEILGFPCNQFGGQEPGTNEDAVSFCQLNFGVKFPILSKVEVNGDHAHPLFNYLKKAAPFKGFNDENVNSRLLKLMISEKNPEWLVGDEIKWNFTKFLISSEGKVLRRYEPTAETEDIKNDISKLVKVSS